MLAIVEGTIIIIFLMIITEGILKFKKHLKTFFNPDKLY